MLSQNQSEKGGRATTAATTTTTIRPLSGLRNPRIVRASREFGGKDRHSKVSTVKGLRDRRVRLSVPTAIQLYDLQDKLGLNQPSKVVDWLLSKAQNEIDRLPPLQFPLPENSNFANFSENLGLSREANGKDLLSTSAFLQSADSKQGFDSNDPYISYYPWEQASNAYFSQLGIITRAGTHRPDMSDITPSSMSLLADPSQMVNLCTPKIVPPMMFAPMHGGFDGSLVLQNPQSNSQRINDQPLFQ